MSSIRKEIDDLTEKKILVDSDQFPLQEISCGLAKKALWSSIISNIFGAARTVSGIFTISDTTDATSKDMGALIVEGGIGVEKNINAGGYITGDRTISNSYAMVDYETVAIDSNGLIFYHGDGTDPRYESIIIDLGSTWAFRVVLPDPIVAFAIDWSGNITTSGNLSVVGALSKGSGSFNIKHPHPDKEDTHRLVHSFVESPKADLIYSGMVELVDGVAEINIDTESKMTEGTFVLLCRDARRFTTNEGGFTRIKSSLSGNLLTIEAEDLTCTDEIFWQVIGERQDDHMYATDWTDEDGKVIVEPENEEE